MNFYQHENVFIFIYIIKYYTNVFLELVIEVEFNWLNFILPFFNSSNKCFDQANHPTSLEL